MRPRADNGGSGPVVHPPQPRRSPYRNGAAAWVYTTWDGGTNPRPTRSIAPRGRAAARRSARRDGQRPRGPILLRMGRGRRLLHRCTRSRGIHTRNVAWRPAWVHARIPAALSLGPVSGQTRLLLPRATPRVKMDHDASPGGAVLRRNLQQTHEPPLASLFLSALDHGANCPDSDVHPLRLWA
jgi:hypothetical protein